MKRQKHRCPQQKLKAHMYPIIGYCSYKQAELQIAICAEKWGSPLKAANVCSFVCCNKEQHDASQHVPFLILLSSLINSRGFDDLRISPSAAFGLNAHHPCRDWGHSLIAELIDKLMTFFHRKRNSIVSARAKAGRLIKGPNSGDHWIEIVGEDKEMAIFFQKLAGHLWPTS